MKDYFNADQKGEHIKITCTQVALEEMLKYDDCLTEEEQEELKTALKAVTKFNELVFQRLGKPYERKVLSFLRTNTVKIVRRSELDTNAVSECAVEDLVPKFHDLRLQQCFGCTICKDKEKWQNCGIQAMGTALDIEGIAYDEGCPYKMDNFDWDEE